MSVNGQIGDVTTSHPSRGGWIEIQSMALRISSQDGPTPRGVGGLKSKRLETRAVCRRPTPRGVGGLKSVDGDHPVLGVRSHPSRGGWIEISVMSPYPPVIESHPSRGGWIEIVICFSVRAGMRWSHPSRGGWIEIVPPSA